MTQQHVYTHGHLFCGLGGGAKGFNRSRAALGGASARMRCVGGIDVDAAAIRDFEQAASVRGTVLDLFDRDQYSAFHGTEPPRGWREATTTDIHNSFHGERPDIVFLSAPCKGFSGLMSETKSRTDKYIALNRLTLRGVWLLLESYKGDLPSLIVFENVPRIATRGRHLLDQIAALLQAYGYAVNETTHDCGELGGLAQSRKRFLLVARQMEKVPPFLYEPVKRPLISVGAVLGRMPLAGDIENAGPMHRVPALQWKTWVRLAFVEAGKDWRSLNRLRVEDGYLKDFLIVPDYRAGFLGVRQWDESTGTVAGESGPTNGAFSVADPRAPSGAAQYQQYGVLRMEETAGAVIGVKSPGQGTFSVADPRHGGRDMHHNQYRIVPWADSSTAVTGAGGKAQCVQDPRANRQGKLFSKYPVSGWDGQAGTVIGGDDTGAYAVADPRREGPAFAKYPVAGWDEASRTVISGSTTGQGAFAVADPRPGMQRERGDHYLTGGHYGVVDWHESSGAVSASAGCDNGRWSVADHRLPAATANLVAHITAEDGTWHRPFTTLELACLQSLVDPEEKLVLDGLSDQAWRERIGNAVPPDAAEAIGNEMLRTLLMVECGQTFALNDTPIWVRDVAVAIALPGQVGA